MAHLSELMSGPQRTAVINDCGELVEGVVAKQSGITGMALKGAVAATFLRGRRTFANGEVHQ